MSNKSHLRSQVDGPSTQLDDVKYAGNKSSRARIFGNASDSDDNDESFMTARSALDGNGDRSEEDGEDSEEDGAENEYYEQAQPFGAVQESDDEEESNADTNANSDQDDEEADEALTVKHGDDDDDDANEEDLQQSVKLSQNLDKQRGQAVVAQLKAYDKLLEMRIGMQKAVTQVNNICADEERDFVSGNEEAIESTLSALNEVSESLFSIREKFVKYDSHTAIPPRKRPRLEESSAIEYAQGAAQDSIDLAKSYEPHLIDTLKTTSNKVSLASTKGFSSVNKDAWSQVEDVLREFPKLRGRVGIRRGNNATTRQYEAEVFDDGDFYQTLLKEIIESKTGEGGETEQVVKPNKKKVKKDVDTRATKGRKLKYNVHDKLQNFMVPVPPPKEAWAESQISELFSSLMGHSMPSQTASESIGNLKLF